MSTTRAPADLAAPGASTASAWDWIVAGALGGAGAGGLDAGTAIARGIGGLGLARAVHLLVLATSMLAAAGVLAGALVAALGAALRRRGASGTALARREAGLSALLASPAVVFV
ncbi:MAG TPA: hypothetical protein VMT47_12725, partial [Polyangia bacterium]|nr:hypothetical protein [Polyangia bacterium]